MVRCILYPGSKIVVASSVKSQAIELISKIEKEFLQGHDWGSANLQAEIKFISSNINKPIVEFKNGSWIVCVVSGEGARGHRANVLVVDESAIVDPDTVTKILQPMLSAPRQPGYLSKPEYKDMQERNCELYLTSAKQTWNWMYKYLQTSLVNMLDSNKRYFCCDLPYQIAVKEGLLQRDALEDKMSESTFDQDTWNMEMCGTFLGQAAGAFFKYEDIDKRRKIKKAFLPLVIYNTHNIVIPELERGEERILSIDVALMASKKHQNDATALTIGRCLPTKDYNYEFNEVYLETHEGMLIEELATLCMRLFYGYHCTTMVLDCMGNGEGVYEAMTVPKYDNELGITYSPLCSMNDDAMIERCRTKGAQKSIWTIKASADLNSRIATSLRAGFQNGYINLMVDELAAEDALQGVRGYKSFSDKERALCKLPYVETTMLVREISNLTFSMNGGSVKVKERYGERKDRYSSIAYGYYVMQELALQRKNLGETNNDFAKMLASYIRPAVFKSGASYRRY